MFDSRLPRGGGIIRVAEGKGHARRIPTAIQQWVSGRAFGDWAAGPKQRAKKFPPCRGTGGEVLLFVLGYAWGGRPRS